MTTGSYLTLRTERIKPSEKWACEGDDLYLLFLESGAGQISAYASTLRLGPGDMLVVSGRSAAKLAPATQPEAAELEFRWFALSTDSLFPLFSPAEVSFLQNVTQEFRTPKLYPRSSPIANRCRLLLAEVPPRLDLVHRSQVLKVAAVLLADELHAWQQKQSGTGDGTDDHMLRVFEKLSSDELLNLSVEELADRFGCSRRHLSRLFHQRFGVSVAALRMEMRLLKASSLLRDPGVKVTNVAEQCGFNHLGLFNTCFKRRFGATPGMWRSLMNEKKPGAGKAGAASGDGACPLIGSGACPMAGRVALPAMAAVPAGPAGHATRRARNLMVDAAGMLAAKTGILLPARSTPANPVNPVNPASRANPVNRANPVHPVHPVNNPANAALQAASKPGSAARPNDGQAVG